MSSQQLPPRARLSLAKVCADIGFVPNGAQRLIFEAAQRPGIQKVVAACGIRAGKSTAAAVWLYARCLAPTVYPGAQPVEAHVASPTHALSSRIFDYVVRLYQQHSPELITSLRSVDGYLHALNLAGHPVVIRRLSTERVSSNLGFSSDLMAVDECGLMGDEEAEALLGRLIDRRGESFWVSSPRGTGGPFARLFREGLRGASDVASVQAPSWANEALPRDEIKKMRARMSDTAFRQDVGGEFCERAGAVFDPSLVEASATGQFEEPIPGVEYHAGLDLAATTDRTVLTIARKDDQNRMRVVFVDSIAPGLEWSAQVERVARHVRRYNDCSIRADATGSGQPVVEMLRNAGLTVQAFVFTSSSKAALVRHGVLLLERGVVLPLRSLASTADEMCLYQWLDERGDRCGAPVGSHDDAVASWLLCAKSFYASGDGEGRACVNGVDRPSREPEMQRPKVEVQPPAPKPKTAAQLEAERMVRALYPKAPQHDDGEPNRPGTTPRARPGWNSGIWDPAP